METIAYDVLGHTKREIALYLKREDSLTLAGLARRLGISREAVRVQINEMVHEGWVARDTLPQRRGKAGRPATGYRLTVAGQHLFPKYYDGLATMLLQIGSDSGDAQRAGRMLEEITERRLAPWRERMEGLSLQERLELLTDLYFQGDPFVEVQRDEDCWMLVEHNCPFLNVALEYPAICSTSVNLMSRLLGVRVVRVERFQAGHNRCTFRILPHEPYPAEGFELEPEPRTDESPAGN